MAVERVYGLHTVRALLKRAPQRVLRVFLQQGRSDERAGRCSLPRGLLSLQLIRGNRRAGCSKADDGDGGNACLDLLGGCHAPSIGTLPKRNLGRS